MTTPTSTGRARKTRIQDPESYRGDPLLRLSADLGRSAQDSRHLHAHEKPAPPPYHPRETCASEEDIAAALRASVLSLHIESTLSLT